MRAHFRTVVVIQGPIVSSGMSGSGLYRVDFDCSAGIERMVSEYSSVVAGFVLATWDDQNFHLENSKLSVLRLEDPGPRKTFFSKGWSNDLRQAWGCLQGITFAINYYQPDYIVRVRTDQYVNISAIVDHVTMVDATMKDYERAGQVGFLYFPNMMSWSPYSVGDFYIAGRAADIQNFFEAQVHFAMHAFTNALPWVHSDLILRHAHRNLKQKLPLDLLYWFPNVAPALRMDKQGLPSNFRYNVEVLALWSELLTTSVSFFPRAIFDALEWRGSRMAAAEHSIGEFYEDWGDARRDTRAWFKERHPSVYYEKTPLDSLERFISFNSEKAEELESGHPTVFGYLSRILRTLLSLSLGRFPCESLPLSAWQWVRLTYVVQ